LQVRGCLSVPRFTDQFVTLDSWVGTFLFPEALHFFD
jgi:hypothetical protein